MIITDTLFNFCGVMRAFTWNASHVTFGGRGSIDRNILQAWSKRNLGSYLEGPFVDPKCCHNYLGDHLFLFHIINFQDLDEGRFH